MATDSFVLPDGTQLWEHEQMVHAARLAQTMCGEVMHSDGVGSVWDRGNGASAWLPVAPTHRVTCPGCAAALELKEGSDADRR